MKLTKEQRLKILDTTKLFKFTDEEMARMERSHIRYIDRIDYFMGRMKSQ